MITIHSCGRTLMLLLFLMLGLTTAQSSITCSNQNTGSSSKEQVNMYMSNGWCSDNCQGYAYAIVQGKSCWCSNYAPADTQSSSDCSESCPGYPDNKCGNTEKGYFGYILLSTPSGTQGASSSSSPSSTSSSSSSSSTSSSSSSTSTSSSSTSSSDSSSSSSSSSQTSASVVTITGQAQTITATPTSTSQPGATGSFGALASQQSGNSKKDDDKGDSFFDHKGKVAGVFTAVSIVALGLIAALLLFLMRRRNRQVHAEDGSGSPNSFFDAKVFKGGSVSGQGSAGDSAVGGAALKRDQSTATTLAGLGFDEKHSRDATIVPITVDQRLDPGQMFMRWDHNDSRRSLQDEHDYSRKVLRVTNPDNDNENA